MAEGCIELSGTLVLLLAVVIRDLDGHFALQYDVELVAEIPECEHCLPGVEKLILQLRT